MAQDDTMGVLDQEVAVDETIEPVAAPEPPEEASPAVKRPDHDQPAPIAQDLAAELPNNENLDRLLDVNLKINVELGRTRLKFRDVLDLSPGSIVELNKQTSEPVDILVNGALLATGEVVVIDDHFAIRINKLLSKVERLKRII